MVARGALSAAGPQPGRSVPPADWHVTLCFLGAVPEPLLPALQASAARLHVPGFVLRFDTGLSLYAAGDTNVFGDMRIIGDLYQPTVAILPIGDFYTMGPREAAYATRLLGVRGVIPAHYGTFPALTGTPAALKQELAALGKGDVEVAELRPGQTLG